MAGVDEVVKDNQISIFSIPSLKYNKNIKAIAKAVSDHKKGTTYVSLNKPYQTILNDIKKAGANPENFSFIDAVSAKVSSAQSGGKAVFVSSPRAMTEISIAITKSVSKFKSDCVMFDSLSTLLVYEGTSTVLRFVHSIISNIRVKGKSCVFTILKEDLSSELVKDLSMFVDKIVELN